MTKTGKTIVGVIVVLIVIGIVVGITRGKGTPKTNTTAEVATKGTIKIGVLAPLTGDGAVYGEPAVNVYKLAVNEINTAGGINGQNIELIVEDSKCNGKDGASAAQKLVNVDHVQVILGGICSGETLSSVPVVETGKVALFSAGASSPELTSKSSFFSRDYPSDSSQGTVLADAATKLGYKKIAFADEQTDYVLGVYSSFSTEFQKAGGKTVKEEFLSDATDMRSVLIKLQAEKPDALFVNTQTVATTVRVLKQIQELGWKTKIFLNDVSMGDPKLVSDNSKILEGALGAEFKINLTNSKFPKVIADYKTQYGADMPYQSYGQTEYDAVYLLKDAITAVGNDGTKVAQWLRTVKDWPGASGAVTIDPATGDRVGGHNLEVVKDGKVQPYITQ